MYFYTKNCFSQYPQTVLLTFLLSMFGLYSSIFNQFDIVRLTAENTKSEMMWL